MRLRMAVFSHFCLGDRTLAAEIGRHGPALPKFMALLFLDLHLHACGTGKDLPYRVRTQFTPSLSILGIYRAYLY